MAAAARPLPPTTVTPHGGRDAAPTAAPRCPDVDPADHAHRRRHGRGFWAVAFAFAAIMALSTVPSPLYPLYVARDGLSPLTITLVYAAYAIGVVGSLFLAGHVSDWHGRRRVLLPALATAALSAGVFLAWTDLWALFLGRVLNGIAIGAVTATATAYLAELHARHRPDASAARAQLVATAANLGGIGLGPLVSGALAQGVGAPLDVPYAVALAALLLGAVAVAVSPETRERPVPRPRYRAQRVAVPRAARGRFFAAALGALLAFATLGLFTGLASTILTGTMHRTSPLLAGASIFVAFAAGVAAQLGTGRWGLRRTLGVGMALIAIGLAVLVLAVWLPTPSLTLFLLGGAVAGAGSGALFKGTLGTVVGLATDDGRAEALAGLFLAGYVGLSVPVVGVGLALQGTSTRVALLGFAVLVVGAVLAAAPTLLGRPGRPASAAPPEAV
ncbi:MFS transporter [Patulibacter sp. SYSU D01012]|uniref:MFS transporter n=1 Tax=Patulibacter sp. SYSU D01012 TaxID=2817381 RepID=UPI001B3109CA|nr:MFS transporter [Patulibacter sp. SYSU D01012]